VAPPPAFFGERPVVNGVTLPGAQVPLFNSGHVALATFFGTVLGGAVLMSINEKRLGRSQQAMLTLIFGVLACIVMIGIAFVLPSPGGAPFGLATIFGMRAIAEKRLGPIVKAHTDAGGKVASGWAAFGIGLGSLCAAMVPVFIIAVIAAMVSGGAASE
jgi:hypothetical protein